MFILCGFDCACELAFIMIYTLMNHGYNIVTRLDCITLQFDNLGGTFDLISPLSYEFDKCWNKNKIMPWYNVAICWLSRSL